MQTNKIQIDNTFSREYECSALDSVPSAGVTLYCYPGGHVNCQVEGLVLEIVPYSEDCEMWVGSFAWGDLSPNALTGVYSYPSPKHLLVVAKGEAYIVNVEDPSEHEHLKILPVMGAVTVPDVELIALYDFTRLEGYGVKGRRWQTPSLSWDGLRNVKYDGKSIVGEVWDSPNDAWVSFRVDPSDGTFVGGVSPELVSNVNRRDNRR